MKGLLALAVVSLAFGCRATRAGPYASASEATRNTVEAQRLNLEAADLIASDPAQAEALLRDSLANDLFFGPAHNNLGVLYLKEGKLYEAAGEFEWARKLMPGHPDPRLNLAITLEKAGQTDEAIKAYEAALEVYSDYLPAIQALAVTTVRAGRDDARLAVWLDAIAMRSDDERWRGWAQRERARIPNERKPAGDRGH